MLAIRRVRVIDALKGAANRRRAAEMERDRQRTIPPVPTRPSGGRRTTSDRMSDAATAAAIHEAQLRLAQAEARVLQAQQEISALKRQLEEIDRTIERTRRSDDQLRNNWSSLECSRTTGKRLPWRIHPPTTPSAADFIA